MTACQKFQLCANSDTIILSPQRGHQLGMTSEHIRTSMAIVITLDFRAQQVRSTKGVRVRRSRHQKFCILSQITFLLQIKVAFRYFFFPFYFFPSNHTKAHTCRLNSWKELRKCLVIFPLNLVWLTKPKVHQIMTFLEPLPGKQRIVRGPKGCMCMRFEVVYLRHSLQELWAARPIMLLIKKAWPSQTLALSLWKPLISGEDEGKTLTSQWLWRSSTSAGRSGAEERAQWVKVRTQSWISELRQMCTGSACNHCVTIGEMDSGADEFPGSSRAS